MTFVGGNPLQRPRPSLSIRSARSMTIAQEFAVSCLSASLAHIPHHPLYTLKSQMMYYGRDFSLLNFMRRTRNTNGTFLFQGVFIFLQVRLLTCACVCVRVRVSLLWLASFYCLLYVTAGVVPRTFGIAPEKALKMQAWVLVGRWVDRHVDKPTFAKWSLAGAAAGAATTLIGESPVALH